MTVNYIFVPLMAASLSLSAGWWDSNQSHQAAPHHEVRLVTDRELQTKVNDILNGGWFATEYPRVTATVSNGTVTLEGAVESVDAKRSLDAKVADISGVKSVRNDVTVDYVQNSSNTSSNNFSNNFSNTSEENHNQMSDQELQKEVNKALNTGWFGKDYPHVGVTVSNGRVTLNGVVETVEQKREVERKVQDINGVRSVRNNIEVEAERTSYNGSKETNYRDIQQKVDRLQSKSWFSRQFPNVQATTSQGIVTVKGEVKTQEEQRAVLREMQNIPGVKKVVDRTRVKTSR